MSDLSALSRTDYIGRTKVNPGIDASIDNLLDSLVECGPLASDARKRNGNRHLRILSKQRLENGGHGAAVRRMPGRIFRVRRRRKKRRPGRITDRRVVAINVARSYREHGSP